MDIKVETPAAAPSQNDQKTPLLTPKTPTNSSSDDDQNSAIRKAISSTFKGTAYLASRLPTGTVLTFQLLTPILSNHGVCDDATRIMTAVLLALCGLSCFVLSFTDSYKDATGKVIYGFATFRGFYAIDRSVSVPPEEAKKRKISALDFLQAFLSLLVFATIALLDSNVVNCFYTKPSVEMGEVLNSLPIANGVICSVLIVTFPTQRHGIDRSAPTP
ncbi:OLC1v1039130C1 [Oldenlandia corymbosa var. corymbosa]|uniref:OLC1v1039130C1 n=1 Tax=Oldenlandia corymbosa var. corymbosa TaxID=529605 RepID=A0AAV1D1U4_OLDCO|nr:OLC1v1039130C1 [Oldenlandia corymbosa var. corymbosa]